MEAKKTVSATNKYYSITELLVNSTNMIWLMITERKLMQQQFKNIEFVNCTDGERPSVVKKIFYKFDTK